MNRVFRVFIVLVIIVSVLSVVTAWLGSVFSPDVGALVFVTSWVVLAAIAIWDGAMRLAGRHGLLGANTRLSRATAIVQIILGLGVLLSVLSGLG